MGRLVDNRFSVIQGALLNTSTYNQTYRDCMLNSLQYKINSEFEYAFDIINIKTVDRENGTQTDILTRVTKALKTKNTSLNYSEDDYRNIIFRDTNYSVNLGDLFYFANYYWVVTNTDNINSPTTSADVRKSNYMMKWVNDSGDVKQIPGFVTNKNTLTSGIDELKDIIVADGERVVVVPSTSETLKIKRNSRFFISKDNINNPLSYQVINIENTILDGLIIFKLQEQGAEIDTTNDNFELGICDYYNKIATYQLSIINGDNLQTYINQPLQLNVQVTKTINGIATNITSTSNVIYESSDETIATVDNVGLITFNDIGNVVVTAKLSNDNTVIDTISLDVINIPQNNYTVEIVGVSEIATGQTKTYSFVKKNNGVVFDGSLFDIQIINGISPISSYTLSSITDTSCSIKCNSYTYYITLRVFDRDNHSLYTDKIIKLKGLI